MKQTNLYTSHFSGIRESPCLGRVVATWAAYGFGMALLWEIAGSSAPAHVVVWSVALLLGAWLALDRRELWP